MRVLDKRRRQPSYARERPYRRRVVDYHKELGLIEFTNRAQFWTLGGPEHVEFPVLNEQLRFGPRSYHTVDRRDMQSTEKLPNREAVVVYPKTEFDFGIADLWSSPLAISYDSTETMLPPTNDLMYRSQDDKIVWLCQMIKMALTTSTNKLIVVHANWMLGFGTVRRYHWTPDLCRDTIEKWMGIVHNWFPTVSFCGKSVVEIMKGSHTEMFDMHFVVTK